MKTKIKKSGIIGVIISVVILIIVCIIPFLIIKGKESYHSVILSETSVYNDNADLIGISVTERITIKKREGNSCKISIPLTKQIHQTFSQDGLAGSQIINHSGKVETIKIKRQDKNYWEGIIFYTDENECNFNYSDSEDVFDIVVVYIFDKELDEKI